MISIALPQRMQCRDTIRVTDRHELPLGMQQQSSQGVWISKISLHLHMAIQLMRMLQLQFVTLKASMFCINY